MNQALALWYAVCRARVAGRHGRRPNGTVPQDLQDKYGRAWEKYDRAKNVLRRASTFIFALLLAANVLAQALPQRHDVKAGKHDYKPGHGLGLRFGAHGKHMTVTLALPAEAWFDPTERGPIGTDGADWNKVGGFSFLNLHQPKTWKKNSMAAMVAWRPAPDSFRFELALYINRADATWLIVPVAQVGPDEVKRYRLSAYGTSVQLYDFTIPRTFVGAEGIQGHLRVNVGPWFGGNRQAPLDSWIYSDAD